MRTIRVDDQTHEMIVRLAVPYVDKDENETLRRELPKLLQEKTATLSSPPASHPEVNGRHPSGMGRSTRRPSNGAYTSQKVYWRPILETLEELGGRAPIGEILRHLPGKVNLTASDYERTKSGWILWESRACWARQNMKDQGLLLSDSPRGVWEIADEGRRALAENRF